MTGSLIGKVGILLLLSGSAMCAQQPVDSVGPGAKTGAQLKALLGESFTRNTFASLQGPYHLLATFQTFNGDGEPAGDGSIERYFASPGHVTTITKFGGHTSTAYYEGSEWRYTDDGFTGSILTYFVREFLLNPIYPPAAFEKRDTQTTVTTLMGTTMDCASFILERRSGGPWQPPADAYCVSRDSHDLVMHQTNGFTARYRDFAPFQDRSIARSIVVSKGAHTRIRIKIETVDDAVLPEEKRTAPADALPMDPGPEIRAYSADEGRRIGGGAQYVPRDDRAYKGAFAIMYVLISRDGKVIDAEPRFVSKPELTKTAMSMALGSRYEPLIRKGVPVENIVTTTIPLID